MPEKCPNCKDGYHITPGGTLRCNRCEGSGNISSREDLIALLYIQNELLEEILKHTSGMWSDLRHKIDVSISEANDIIRKEKMI